MSDFVFGSLDLSLPLSVTDLYVKTWDYRVVFFNFLHFKLLRLINSQNIYVQWNVFTILITLPYGLDKQRHQNMLAEQRVICNVVTFRKLYYLLGGSFYCRFSRTPSDVWWIQSMLQRPRHLPLDRRFAADAVWSPNSLPSTKFFPTAHH